MKKIKIITSILLPISLLPLIAISCNNQKQDDNKKQKIDISKLNL
ncbi:variable surface lipoprotein [Metamycoplasma alkalescens]|nr:variable surface lipoprotein [Metamycoplasma alkalescens]